MSLQNKAFEFKSRNQSPISAQANIIQSINSENFQNIVAQDAENLENVNAQNPKSKVSDSIDKLFMEEKTDRNSK
jgi:thymidylate kinase